MMILAQNIAWNALADFFCCRRGAVYPLVFYQWCKEGAYCQDLDLVFPMLSLLLSIVKIYLWQWKKLPVFCI